VSFLFKWVLHFVCNLSCTIGTADINIWKDLLSTGFYKWSD